MTSSTIPARPVITAWSAVSPFGIGKDEFAAGVVSGKDSVSTLDAEQWSGPDDHACVVPGFALREVLGKKGTRSMDRVTGLAVTAVRDLLRDSAGARLGDAEGTGLVLGTTTGSAQSMMDFTRASLVGERPFYVDPSQMPNAVMNCAAGQCAIWHELKGPNTTIAGGRVAGLSALSYAAGLLASGRAESVLCGAAEEFSSARAWLDHHRRGAETALLGEGCAMFLLQPAGSATPEKPALAEILAIESRVYLEGDLRSALRACVDGVLARGGVADAQVWAVSPSGIGGFTGEQEQAVLTARFGEQVLGRAPSMAPIGDTAAASAAFQIASLLGLAERSAAPSGAVALVSAVDDNGLVSCAALRLLGA
ncbi:beta-ketoacyl synthase N-terminal-like domain-containing protein [Amycolatopsis sp. H20-H5]|uniref:beta-ketoacyl synthase N-terminal-like domain-containing protein n=1 Tax=Amycolatopsis sp. H20-H5 TaxID=3046309 RepID=UPI002DBD9D14|nr:beta-ketoacyl synthase N-terminal-like domain-containing protein [Amycolatopsis sp. H20-H5]MEC3979491.1 beta-ketoacyl synthase N-terminal-like domain-containing protein [Amycolatopsis sp. H20-H5]